MMALKVSIALQGFETRVLVLRQKLTFSSRTSEGRAS
jgi:hypothetical protein